MAELSSLDTVKSRSRPRSRRFLESCESTAVATGRPTRKRANQHPRNHLYDIEIVEEEQYRAKVHYAGYSSEYDEWIRKSEIAYKPTFSEQPDQELSLLSTLACGIKQKLVPSRKIEDPAVRIQLPFDQSTF